MKKHMKYFIVLITLLFLTISVASASDNTTTHTNKETLEQTTHTVEKVATSTEAKKIIKENKTKKIKTATKTVEVNNYNELKTAINSAINDNENDSYIINLNSGTYQITSNQNFVKGAATPNITINGNGNIITPKRTSNSFTFNTGSNITLNDIILSTNIKNYDDTTLKNTTLKMAYIDNYENATLHISDDVIFEESFLLYNYGTILDDTNKIQLYLAIYNGTYILENCTIVSSKTNNGNLTIKNSTLDAIITNNGQLIIADDVTFGNSFGLVNNGEIITNKTSEIAKYLTSYNGNYTLKDIEVTSAKTNNGNLSIINCTVNAAITNNGNLIFDNDTFNPSITHTNNVNGTIYLDNLIINNTFYNHGVIYIGDNVTYGENLYIQFSGPVISNDTTKIAPHLNYLDKNYNIENVTDKNAHTNEGFLTIKNSTILGNMNNYGTIHAINSTLNSSITSVGMNKPTGTFIFEDDVLFGTNFGILSSDYIIIMNDTSRITPYLSFYIGNKLLENYTIGFLRTNNGNLTTRNVTFNYAFTNNKNLTIENSTLLKDLTNDGSTTIRNSTLNSRIANNNILILEDNNTYGSSFTITGSGKIIASDINEVFPYINEFTGETTIELGDYTKTISNSGNLTIENSTLNNSFTNYNNKNANLKIKNSTIQMNIQNSGTLELNNVTLNGKITNTGTLILGDNVILGENFNLESTGEVISNDTEKFIDYLTTYTGNVVLNNKNITTPKTNKGTLTLNNSIINSTIRNDGKIIIDDNTIFGENAKITGIGEIETNDITKILPIIEAINGNFVINDVTLNKSYVFNGRVTLNNCTTNSPNNTNFGTLNLNNCTVNVGEENKFIDNLGTLHISKDTEIIGKINELSGEVIDEGAPKRYIVNNNTVTYFFTDEGITSMVNPGDILDFQGTITPHPEVGRFIIDKPVNIISSTHDGRIENFAVVNFTKASSGSNVTGLYTHNTQFYVWNADHIVFDNISNVVEDKQVGWGVGQTSIRENSSYITVKNSYFYTKNNGGSSTLVLAWANYCDIINNTIIGGGNNGNLLYLTTYNVIIPDGAIFNSYNNLINNTLIGPETPADICYGICISGSGNIVDGNNLTYSGQGIMAQWGSGVDGVESEESVFKSTDNIIRNNNLYGGCGINNGDIIYNNYMEGTLRATKAKAYNNTANDLYVSGENTEVYNNTINGKTEIASDAKNTKITNNTLKGDITIKSGASNNTITYNNITGTITLEGQNNTITNNNITTNEEYTITGKRDISNNTITDNYLQAANKAGKASINLRTANKNTIENNYPHNTKTSIKNNNPNLGDDLFIIVKVTDEDDKPLANAEITLKINDKEETLTTNNNGEIVYIYTPESEGNYTISAEFKANDIYTASQNTTTVNIINTTKVVEDLKEELANATQKADDIEKQLKDANQTINNQKTTLDNLNKTLTQTQKDLQNANKKITEQNQTINNLNKQLTDANNKINNLNKSNNDLNNKLNDANKKVDNLTNANNNLNKQLADADKKIDALTKQNADLEKQLADLKQKVDALTKTVDTLNKTVAARDNTIKELTTKTSTKITVNKINTTTVGSTVTVTGKVTDKNGKALNNMPVSIKINTGTTKAVTNANGVYKYTTTAWSVGTSNVTVSSIANDKYTTSSAKTTFKVSKAKPVLKLNSISAVKYKDKVTVTGSLMDNNNKAINGAQITLKINSKSVTVKTGKDGSFTYTTSATSMGTNNVTATYNGNTKYTKVTAKTTFKVNKQNLILTVDRVASGLKYKDPLVVGGRLVDGNGKAVANSQVSLKFNGKTYKAKTDKNGYYKVTTRATTMDKNNLTVTYAGNKYYNKATAKTTFTVAKQDLVITFNTVKYSNGKVTISGTFTDRNRHALMNSLARITLNGKQGTAKTDKTGTFTYTTKASKGTYKVTLAYPGNARYNAYSKTSTVSTA